MKTSLLINLLHKHNLIEEDYYTGSELHKNEDIEPDFYYGHMTIGRLKDGTELTAKSPGYE